MSDTVKMKKKYGLWDIIQWIAIIIMLVWMGQNLWERHDLIADHEKAPELHLHSYDGKEWGLERFKGKPVLVNFWGTWCPPCMHELPLFVDEQLRHTEIQFIGVAVGSPVKDVFETIRKFKIPYPIATTDQHDLNVWKASSLPTTYLLDKDHRLLWSTKGAVSKGELSDIFEEYLK